METSSTRNSLSFCMNEMELILTELNELEERFAERLRLLFGQVDPQKPEKGIAVLLKRAREQAAKTGQPMEQALEEVYQSAAERTARRVELLSSCPLTPKKEQP